MPLYFIEKKIYLFQSNSITNCLLKTVDSHPEKFVLAKITGYNKTTRLFRLDLLQKDNRQKEFCHVQLEKEQFFFRETILKGCKLYKEIEQKGLVLDIK